MFSVSRAMLIVDLKPIDTNDVAGAVTDSGNGSINLINKAPHPNAAKVFLNWILTKDAQTTYVEKLSANSRRLDVQGRGEYVPTPGLKYVHSQKEEIVPDRTRATEIAKEIIK